MCGLSWYRGLTKKNPWLGHSTGSKERRRRKGERRRKEEEEEEEEEEGGRKINQR